MLFAAVGALLACALLGWTAPALLRSMRPHLGVVLIAGASFGFALAAGIALSALALALVARMASIAATGHWSAVAVAIELPVPTWLGAAAAAAVVGLLARAAFRTAGILVSLVRAERACQAVSPHTGSRIVIVDDESADAFTISGIHGRVVMSRRLLEALSPADRRVVTAHELAHLHHRHHLYVHAADIAAAANPFLRRVPATVRLGVERWADEDAAESVGDRQLAARALARVALLRNRLRRLSDAAHASAIPGRVPVLAASTLAVSTRVQALLAPAPAHRKLRLTLTALAVVGLLVAGVFSLHDVHEVIEGASIFRRR